MIAWLLLATLLGAGRAHAGLPAAPDPTARTAGLAWGEAEIRASHRRPDAAAAPAGERAPPDVVVLADGGATLVVFGGDPLAQQGRLRLRPGTLAEPPPRFSPDRRRAYLATEDGWIQAVDLAAPPGPRLLAEVRVGTRLAALALSSDGGWLLAGNAQPASLVLLRADLALERLYATYPAEGAGPGSAVHWIEDAALRKRFVITLADRAEAWEISYDPHAEDIYDGMVHDFRMGEGLPRRGFLGVRRIKLPQAVERFVLDPPQAAILGHGGTAAAGDLQGHVINLDVRRRIEPLELTEALRPDATAIVPDARKGVLAQLSAASARIERFGLDRWDRRPPLAAFTAGQVLRYHKRSHRLWASSAGDPETGGLLTVVEPVEGAQPQRVELAGWRPVHLDVAGDGTRVFVAGRAAGSGGALLVLDAASTLVLQRLPLDDPRGVHVPGRGP